MKPQERFAVFVKSLGVWILVTGLGTLPLASFQLREFSDPADFFSMIIESIAAPLFKCIAGFWLIRSNWVSEIIYPKLGVTDSSANLYPDQSANSLELFSAIIKTLGIYFIVEGSTRTLQTVDYFHTVDTWHAPSWYKLLILCENIAIPTIHIVLGILFLLVTNWFVRLGFAELLDGNDTAELDNTTSKTPQLALFEVIVKALGIWFFALGLGKLPHAFSQAFSNGIPDSWPTVKLAIGFFALPVMSVIIGGLCFFATDLFVKLAFPKRTSAMTD